MNRVFKIVALSLFVTGAWAQSFTTGYSSLVVFTDGHDTQPAGETEAACLSNEARIVSNYLDDHPEVMVDASKSLPCGPRTSTVPELDLVAWTKLEIPPVCSSCPLLQPDTFGLYYPDFEAEIKDLYFQYGIDQYNKELSILQQKFDLQNFEKEVFILNNEINKVNQ